MFKFRLLLFALIAFVAAEPGLLAARAAVVTADSSQRIGGIQKGIAATPLSAVTPGLARYAISTPLVAPVAFINNVAPFAAASFFW